MKEYLLSLAQNESKDSRIKLNKIRDYVIQTAQQRLSELKERLKMNKISPLGSNWNEFEQQIFNEEEI